MWYSLARWVREGVKKLMEVNQKLRRFTTMRELDPEMASFGFMKVSIKLIIFYLV